MLYSAKELFEKGETQYSLRKKCLDGKLFLVERGLYSTAPFAEKDAIYVCKKFPEGILTGLSAFSFYDLTDCVEDKFFLATKQHSFPIRRDDIVQSYQEEEIFSLGSTYVAIGDGFIRIYDLERTLIELVRLKEKYPPELYFEVLRSFRKRNEELDFAKLASYLAKFKNGGNLLRRIREIV